MHDLSFDTDRLALIPLFIAVEPRDPRGEGRLSEEAIEHVPAATLSEVADALGQLGVPADLLDGAVLGAPGWVVARTVGWSDGRIVRWAPDENPANGPYPTLSSDDVATYLAHELDVACRIASDLEIPGETPGDDAIGLVIERRSGAVVGGIRSTDMPRLAHLMRSDLWFAQIGGASIIAGVDPAADLETVIVSPSTTANIGLKRNGPWRRMGLVRNGRIITAHEWGPQWFRVDPSGGADHDSTVLTLIDEYFDVPAADPADIAEQFDLSPARSEQLTALLDDVDADDPFTSLMRLLELPVEAAEVAEGWLPPADLPDVRRVIEQTNVKAMWSSITTSPTESGPLNDLQRLWVDRPPAYWALAIAETGACAAAAAIALHGGSRPVPTWRRRAGYVLVGLALVNALDLAVPRRWRGHTN
jgi:hypothetical protein